MMDLRAKLAGRGLMLILWGVGVIAAAIFVYSIYSSLVGGKRAAVEAKLNTEVAGAAMDSGRDAVGTVGEQQTVETTIDRTTRGNADEIRAAAGADDAVNPAVRDAGIASLCRRAAYHNDPGCVQLTSPR